MEDDDVDFGHVEHPEGHRRAQVHGDGQRGCLDVKLVGEEGVQFRELSGCKETNGPSKMLPH